MTLVTPDRPDWTGYTVNAPDARLMVAAASGAGNNVQTIVLQPQDRSVMVVAKSTQPVTLVSAIGNVTGLDWSVFGSLGVSPGVQATPTVFPVFGCLDTQVTITLSGAAAFSWWAVVSPDEVLIGTPVLPLSVQTPQDVQRSVQVACPSGATTPLVGGTGGGLAIHLTAMGFSSSVGFTVAATVRMIDAATGGWLCAESGPVGHVTNTNVGCNIWMQDGISVVNASGAAQTAYLTYVVTNLPV